ncbi:DUF2235 domain-containing protein [Pseudomonas sp. CCI1.2]|uniref:T6SS phospholipase effector Tle1-like catalytic domain-containing protein n=1 Tax=unclassified Pseudomonas TaxID=196821 RepID=UPI002AC8F0F6|nr:MULTISPECIES: DUF2235 domain-containing protein [unclassified Pseudomonas]MEB0094445.1 DUF2235 domain-containing protein [Pseudomonas sp. CCI4.2]MEB0123977.1 DUF2235 domain-containing protein [Pseudomonas sp. CCI1.2]WPX55196.1 DUF2235 domain-containing protein [Pseudomonas sp. CCI4.2]
MSSSLNSKSQRPQPSPLTPTPRFKKEGLLPLNSDDVGLNYRKQYRPKLMFSDAVERANRAKGYGYGAQGSPCMDVLNITLCFDGTNNHEPSDKRAQPPTTTNVARLFHASLGGEDNGAKNRDNQEGFYRYYIQGVGTEFKEIGEFEPRLLGLTGAAGGENRIDWAFTRLLDTLHRACGEKRLEPVEAYALVQQMSASLTSGLFSNGNALRRQVLQAPMLALQKKIENLHARSAIPRIIGMRLWIYGFSRGAAEARAFANWLEALTKIEVDGETCYLFAGIPISIAFMGLFDTVASSGIAYAAPFADGHMGWADDTMRLPESEKFLERCVHLVAAHEQRNCFPVDSIRRKTNPDDPNCPSTYRAGTFEYLYPGMHSDVGGGYPPGEQGKSLAGSGDVLSQIPLHHMYSEAYSVGAPLQAPPDTLSLDQIGKWPWLKMSDPTFKAFAVSESLTHRFNTWLDAHQTGPLEDAMEHQAALITAWRINRYASFRLRETSVYQHLQGKDMTDEEKNAFKALYGRQSEENLAQHNGTEPSALSDQKQAKRDSHLAIKQAYEQRTGASQPMTFNTHKSFEPILDQNQLEMAMSEFRRDYTGKWAFADSNEATSGGTLINTLFGGLVYLVNDQDEAEEYVKMRRTANIAFNKLYAPGSFEPLSDKAQTLTDFFDEQVHDSRAWFMNAMLNEREVFGDYFRFRAVFFDDQSNKSLSLIARSGQVIGVGIALASVGLSIKRNDPRYLIGLIIPSLGIPAFRGKLNALATPEVRAFDPVTNIDLPMQDVGALRTFTKNTGDVLKLAKALPLPEALSDETATTPKLKALLKAQKTAKVAEMAKDLFDSLPAEEKTSWLDQIKGAVGG